MKKQEYSRLRSSMWFRVGHRRWLSKNSILIVAISISFHWLGCSSVVTKDRSDFELSKTEEENADKESKALVEEEYSLSADRQELDKLRKGIPVDRRQENDELAFLLKLFNDGSFKKPSEIRNKFSKIMRKKRSKFRDKSRKERKNFSKNERAKRKLILAELKSERKEFMDRSRILKVSPGERKDFFEKLKIKRKNYFAAEKEKRKEYESESKDRAKNFEAYYREKSKEFYAEYKVYSKRYNEERIQKRKLKRARKKMRYKKRMNPKGSSGTALPPELKEFEELSGPSDSLGSE